MSKGRKFQEDESGERLKTISNNELKDKMKLSFNKIIDVRTKEQFVESHIDGAISIPLEELEDNLDKLDRKEEINVICNTGNKSKKAAKILENNGFEMISIVLPGMKEW